MSLKENKDYLFHFHSLGLFFAGQMTGITERSSHNKYQEEGLELPLFDLDTIACATNNFSVINKLGEGGFGTVYKVKKIR